MAMAVRSLVRDAIRSDIRGGAPYGQVPYAMRELVTGQYMAREPWVDLSGKVYDQRSLVALRNGTDRPEIIGRCVKPDGVDDRADLASAISFTGAFTVSYWAKRLTNNKESVVIGTSSGSHKIGYNTTANNMFIRIINGGTGVAVDTGTDTTQWHQITITRDANNKVDLYVNGSLLLRLYSDVAQVGTVTFNRLLNDVAATAQAPNGCIWDIQFINSALTASEVYQLYSLCEFALPNTPRVAWYNCESQHPTLLLDSSGNNRHATCSSHNASVGNFFYEGNDVPGSYANKVGHLVSDGTTHYAYSNGTGLISAYVVVPRSESSKANSAAFTLAGASVPLQYTGEAPRHAQLQNNNCGTFDGVDDYVEIEPIAIERTDSFDISFGIKTTDISGAILGNLQTSSPYRGWEIYLTASGTLQVQLVNTIGSNRIDVLTIAPINNGSHRKVRVTYDGSSSASGITVYLDGVIAATTTAGDNLSATIVNGLPTLVAKRGTLLVAGSLYDLKIEKNGTLTHWFPFSEGKGLIVHNVVPGGAQGSAVGINETTFWGTKQNIFAYNSAMGSSRRMNRVCNNSTTAANQAIEGVSLSYVPDPFGTNFAVRMVPTTTGLAVRRVYTTSNSGVAPSQYLVAYLKFAGRNHFGFIFSGTSSGSLFRFSDNVAAPGEQEVVYNADYGNGWRKVVWKLKNVGTSVLQVFADTSSSYDPANTVDGVDYFFGIVDDWQTQDIRQTTTLAILSDHIPARNDGSGLDAIGLPLIYAPSPGVWPLSEATLNSNPNNAPRRDWSLPANILTNGHAFQFWATTRSKVTPGEIGPDGQPTASKISVDTTPASDHRVFHTTSTVLANREVTYSVYFKPAELSWVILYDGTATKGSYFDLANVQVGSNFISAPTAKGIEAVGGGWCRVWITYTAGANTNPGIYLAQADSDGLFETANGTDGLIAWGAQVSRGTIQPHMPFNYNANDPSDFTPNPPELLQYNSEFDNAYWTKTNTTVTANSDGVADTLTATGTGTGHISVGSITISQGRMFIGKVKIKKPATVGTCRLRALSGAADIFDALLVWDGTQLTVSSVLDGSVIVMPVDADGFCEVLGWGISDGPSVAVFLYPSNSNTAGQAIIAKEFSLKRYFPINPNNFHRRRTSGGQLVGIDRYHKLSRPVFGEELKAMQNLTQTIGS